MDRAFLKKREGNMTKIGIQISSVRKYLQTPEDVLESFRKVSEIGYKAIQIQWINPEISMEFINDALKETNLTCIGTQDLYDVVIDNLEEVIKCNDLWGGTYVTVSGIPERYHSYEGVLEFSKELNKYQEYLKTRGKILNFHGRSKDLFEYNGINSFEIIFENTNEDFQFLLDTYQVIGGGLDPVAWINKVAGRNDIVHFKDGIIDENGNELLMPVGQGATRWEEIFEATIATGVKYALAEQESWQKDPFECLKESYDYIVKSGIK